MLNPKIHHVDWLNWICLLCTSYKKFPKKISLQTCLLEKNVSCCNMWSTLSLDLTKKNSQRLITFKIWFGQILENLRSNELLVKKLWVCKLENFFFFLIIIFSFISKKCWHQQNKFWEIFYSLFVTFLEQFFFVYCSSKGCRKQRII